MICQKKISQCKKRIENRKYKDFLNFLIKFNGLCQIFIEQKEVQVNHLLKIVNVKIVNDKKLDFTTLNHQILFYAVIDTSTTF